MAGWLGTLNATVMFLGSCLIGHAGTLPDGAAKNWYRALGWCLSGVGVLMTISVVAFGWPPRRGDERPAS